MWQYDENAGEWFDDGTDENGNPKMFVEPRRESATMSIPPEPPTEHGGFIPSIIGYGKKAAIEKSPGQWETQFGEEAPPEYVKDIQGTIDALDQGDITEGQLSQKIAQQEQIPGKPSDQQLSVFERLQGFMKHAEPDIEDEARQAKKAFLKQRGWDTGMPLLDHQAKEAADAYMKARDKITAMYQGFAEKQLAAEMAKPQVPSLNEVALRAKEMEIGRPLTPAEQRDVLIAANAEAAGAKTIATEKGKATIAEGFISPEALQIEGIKFATTGKMPAMGMGGVAMRAKIMNAAAAYLKEQGVDPTTVPAMQAEYNATAQTMNAVKKATEQVRGFENGLIKNADYALKLSKDVFRSDIIPVNKVINYFKTNTGDQDIVRFGAAIYAAAMEYEKIRTAGTGITSAELSVGAQKKAEEIMNKAQSHAQLKGVVEAMKQDTRNIMTGREDIIKTTGEELRSLGGMFKNAGGGQGNTVRYTNNGRTYIIPKDKESSFKSQFPNAKRIP